eukprot:SAG25_NODE_10975_length_317_cov_1.183486_1_plen_26_part_10
MAIAGACCDGDVLYSVRWWPDAHLDA